MTEQIQKYFIELAYKGTSYHGWQVQPNALSVQEVLDKALSTFFRQTIDTVGCGRTDTGVHAKQFFVHLSIRLEKPLDPSRTVNSLNGLLPHDIAIKRFIEVNPEAHARFDATLRSYEYYIHFNKDPFKTAYSWLLREHLDLEAMNEAAAILCEYSDFSCFSKSNTQVFTNNCKILNAKWNRIENGLVFRISADRFLRNMVRAIVGTLVDIGKKKIPVDAIRTIIESKQRSSAGASVPACGLYLSKVEYPYIEFSH